MRDVAPAADGLIGGYAAEGGVPAHMLPGSGTDAGPAQHPPTKHGFELRDVMMNWLRPR